MMVVFRVVMVVFRVVMVLMVLMVVSRVVMVVFRYKFALRPEEKPGLEGFLNFLWNKETGEVSVSGGLYTEHCTKI